MLNDNPSDMRGTSLYLFPLLALAAASSSGCMEDMDFDKISSKAEIAPAFMIPLITSDVTVDFLYDEKENAVEKYVNEADGTERIRFRANHDSIATYSIFDLIGLSSDIEYQAVCDLSALSFDHLFDESTDSITNVVTVEMPFPKEIGKLIDAHCDLSIGVEWSGFSHPLNAAVNVGGDDLFGFEIPGSVSDGSESFVAEGAHLAFDNGKLVAKIRCSAPLAGGGKLGNAVLTFKLSNIADVKCEAEPFSFMTSTYITLTQLANFKRIGENVDYKNPRLWLHCSNGTPFDVSAVPVVDPMSSDDMLLGNLKLDVDARDTHYKYELNKSNSKINEVMKSVPDSLSYVAVVSMSMPEGEETVTISKDDKLCLGYSYNVPFDFILHGEVRGDTVEIADIPELTHIEGAKLVVTSESSFPAEVRFNFRLFNAVTGKAASDVIMQNVIPMPNVNEYGVTTETAKFTEEIVLTPKNIEDLRSCGKVLLSMDLNSNGKYVAPKIKDQLRVDVALAVKLVFEN